MCDPLNIFPAESMGKWHGFHSTTHSAFLTEAEVRIVAHLFTWDGCRTRHSAEGDDLSCVGHATEADLRRHRKVPPGSREGERSYKCCEDETFKGRRQEAWVEENTPRQKVNENNSETCTGWVRWLKRAWVGQDDALESQTRGTELMEPGEEVRASNRLFYQVQAGDQKPPLSVYTSPSPSTDDERMGPPVARPAFTVHHQYHQGPHRYHADVRATSPGTFSPRYKSSKQSDGGRTWKIQLDVFIPRSGDLYTRSTSIQRTHHVRSRDPSCVESGDIGEAGEESIRPDQKDGWSCRPGMVYDFLSEAMDAEETVDGGLELPGSGEIEGDSVEEEVLRGRRRRRSLDLHGEDSSGDDTGSPERRGRSRMRGFERQVQLNRYTREQSVVHDKISHCE